MGRGRQAGTRHTSPHSHTRYDVARSPHSAGEDPRPPTPQCRPARRLSTRQEASRHQLSARRARAGARAARRARRARARRSAEDAAGDGGGVGVALVAGRARRRRRVLVVAEDAAGDRRLRGAGARGAAGGLSTGFERVVAGENTRGPLSARTLWKFAYRTTRTSASRRRRRAGAADRSTCGGGGGDPSKIYKRRVGSHKICAEIVRLLAIERPPLGGREQQILCLDGAARQLAREEE